MSRTERRPRPGPAERRRPQLCAETAGRSCSSSECSSRSVVSGSLLPPGLQPSRPLCASDSPGENTAVVAMPSTQGLNPGFPHCRRFLYQLSLQGSRAPLSTTQPKIMPPSRSGLERDSFCPPGTFISVSPMCFCSGWPEPAIKMLGFPGPPSGSDHAHVALDLAAAAGRKCAEFRKDTAEWF